MFVEVDEEVEVEVGEEVELIFFGEDLEGTLRCPSGGKFKTNFSSPNPSSSTFPHRLLTTPSGDVATSPLSTPPPTPVIVTPTRYETCINFRRTNSKASSYLLQGLEQ